MKIFNKFLLLLIFITFINCGGNSKTYDNNIQIISNSINNKKESNPTASNDYTIDNNIDNQINFEGIYKFKSINIMVIPRLCRGDYRSLTITGV